MDLFPVLVLTAAASFAWRMYQLNHAPDLEARAHARAIDGYAPHKPPPPDVKRDWLPRGQGVEVPAWSRNREREQLKPPTAVVARHFQV